MPKALLALLVAVVATGAVVAGALVSRSPEREATPAPQPTYESTPLADLETDDVAVVRASFCDAVPAEAVAESIGAEPRSATTYDNGERARLGTGLRDVAHEFGCGWMAEDATARAWVFAPPVTARSARALASAARSEATCRPVSDAPDFGKPSTATVCELGERVEASHRGLFGDAWLTCTLSVTPEVPRAELVDRTGRWCAAVLEAARA